MTFKRTLILCSLALFTYSIAGLEAKTVDLQTGPQEIIGITVEEVGEFTEIRINTNSLLSYYTMYKPEDPYNIIVELQGVNLGRFTDKLVIDKAGVMEIIPSMVEGAANTARLEIVLTIPVDVKPVQEEKVLILRFYNPEAGEMVAASEEKPELLAEEEEKYEQAPVKETVMIEDIELITSDDKVTVIISGDGKMSPTVSQIDKNKLVLDLPDVTTIVEAVKTYAPPVMGIRIAEYPEKTSIVFDLLESTKYDVSTEGKQIIVTFETSELKVADVTTPSVKAELSGVAKPKPFASKEYVGEKISLDFQDADLVHIFRLLADISGYNIVVSPHVKGKFSMKLVNVPWDQAFDIILRNYGLSKAVEGNIIRVAPTSVLAREEEEIAKAKEALLKAGDLVTTVYPINYADVKKVKKIIKDAKIMTKRGYISVDERTSTLIIKDVETMHPEFVRLIKSLDLPTRQVTIEAKIVEVTTNFTKELGIQWGVLWSPPDSRTTIGGPSIPGGTGFNAGNPLMVNLPAAVQSGSGGAMGIGYISAANTFTLDLQLSAMESSGNGRIISNPRITTSDNQEATIKQGKKIPYQTVSAQGTKTEFVDAQLELTVTPHITPDGTIVMEIQVKKNEADFSRTVGGVPTIDTKEAKTQVLIENGDTLVIGGIFKTNITESYAKVPGLSKIPLIGWLFKKKQNTDTTSELLIFITPRIVE